MAVEKKTTKKIVKKAPAKKAVAAKPAAPKAAVKKTSAKKSAAMKKPAIPQEHFYAMVSEAAYFAAQNDNNRKGAAEYWVEAEAAIRAKFNVA